MISHNSDRGISPMRIEPRLFDRQSNSDVSDNLIRQLEEYKPKLDSTRSPSLYMAHSLASRSQALLQVHFGSGSLEHV